MPVYNIAWHTKSLASISYVPVFQCLSRHTAVCHAAQEAGTSLDHTSVLLTGRTITQFSRNVAPYCLYEPDPLYHTVRLYLYNKDHEDKLCTLPQKRIGKKPA